MHLHSFTYVSTASDNLSPIELENILVQARKNNQEDGITGLLLFADGNFMQSFEGQEDKVKTLFEKIQRDSRHYGLVKIFDDRIFERSFPDWSMAYRDVNRLLDGYSAFMDEDAHIDEFFKARSAAKDLLWSFRNRLR